MPNVRTLNTPFGSSALTMPTTTMSCRFIVRFIFVLNTRTGSSGESMFSGSVSTLIEFRKPSDPGNSDGTAARTAKVSVTSATVHVTAL